MCALESLRRSKLSEALAGRGRRRLLNRPDPDSLRQRSSADPRPPATRGTEWGVGCSQVVHCQSLVQSSLSKPVP